METLSASQFQQKYGQNAVNQFKVGQTVSADQFNQNYGSNQDPRETLLNQQKPQPTSSKIGNFVTDVSNLVGSTKLGQGLSTVFDKNTQNTVSDIQNKDAQAQQSLINAIHAQTDPAKKAHLVNFLKTEFGTDYQEPTASSINPGFGLSKKEVLGSAAQTALSALSFGNPSTEGGVVDNLVSKLPGGESLVKGANAATKAAKPLLEGGGLAGSTARNAALGYGYDVSQRATDNQGNILKPGFGTVLGATLPAVTTLLGTGLKKVLGATTGTGSRIISQAIKNPDEVFAAMKEFGGSEDSKMSLVDQAKGVISDFLKGRNSEFSDSLSSMVSKEPISKSTVTDAFAKEVDRFGGQVKDGELQFGDTALNSSEQKQLQDVWNTVKSWKDVTPQGMDTLRQRIGNEMDTFKMANNGRENVVLGNVKKALTNTMKDNIEGYDKALSDYGKKTQTAKDVLSELNLKGNAKPSTQLNSVMRLFKKDPSVLENITKMMGPENTNTFMNKLAGANLASWVPAAAMQRYIEGSLGAGEILGLITGHLSLPTVLASGAAASPKVVGTGAVATGKLIQKGLGTGLRRAAIKAASKANK